VRQRVDRSHFVWKDEFKIKSKEDPMRGKIVFLFLCFLLVISVSAQYQDKVIGVHTEVKAVFDDGQPDVYAQVSKGDKPGVQMMTCYSADEDGVQWQMIDLSENSEIYWVIEYTAVYNTDIRFHFIMNGPEFYQVYTEWTQARYNNYYVTAVQTNNNWLKGTYTLTVIAEQRKTYSGAESISTCRVKLY
jgi:hypothetical protein